MAQNVSMSITSGPRQSNFELLRIIAMFMVLCLHFNFKYLGLPLVPHNHIWNHDLFTSLCRCFLESLCLPAVNIFILISGWFTIRASYIGLLGYLFQCFFILSVSYIGLVLLHETPVSLEGIASCFILTNYGWFIISYLILYIISPIINKFLKNSQKTTIKRCILLFFSTSILYGWLGGNSNFANGYSIVSFLGLYLLGYYLKNYFEFKLNWTVIFLSSTIINTICIIFDIIFFKSIGISKLLSYINPMIILQAISLLMVFKSLNISQSKMINTVAKSAFAVYLIHDCSKYQDMFFSKLSNHITYTYDEGYSYLYLFLLIIVIYLVAILIDQLRILLWKILKINFISKTLDNRIY